MRRPPVLPIEEHIALGNRMKDAADAVARLLPRFPASTRPSRDAMRVLNALDRLRSSLDTQLCTQVPLARDRRNLATHVYFGDERFGPRVCDPTDLDRDALAAWQPISGSRAEYARADRTVPSHAVS